jgi:DNA-binding GntR family transcriptional regulator
VSALPRVVTIHAYDHVYRLLRHAVLTRTLPPGTRVTESQLAGQLGVSRTPIRDALRRIEGDGLLVRDGKGGLQVVALGRADVEDLFAVRLELDTLAARLANRRASAEEWAEVRRLVDHLAEVAAVANAGSLEVTLAHEAVHQAIYRLAFTPVVAATLGASVLTVVDIAGELSYATDAPGDDEVARQHAALIEVLAGGTGRQAVLAAAEHCRQAAEAAVALVGLP